MGNEAIDKVGLLYPLLLAKLVEFKTVVTAVALAGVVAALGLVSYPL